MGSNHRRTESLLQATTTARYDMCFISAPSALTIQQENHRCLFHEERLIARIQVYIIGV